MQSPPKSTFQIRWHNQTPLLNVVASFSIKLSEVAAFPVACLCLYIFVHVYTTILLVLKMHKYYIGNQRQHLKSPREFSGIRSYLQEGEFAHTRIYPIIQN